MRIDGISGNAGSFADKLADERFDAPYVAAQQRRKFPKYELHHWNVAQHNGQFRKTPHSCRQHLEIAC
jgi:hypothetical protein